MKQWRIRTKRDWVIAACFLLLISYVIASRYEQRLNEWLMKFSPEKMGYFNQPEKYGVYLLGVLLAAALWSILWIWQRQMAKASVVRGLLAVWAAALLLLCGIWYAYRAECCRIVETPNTGLKPNVTISSWDVELPEPLELTEEEQQRLTDLCLQLQALPDEEQEIMREQMGERKLISIHIRYPKYKNHSYWLWFFLEGDKLCLNRGHSMEDAVFYDGTEAAELVEKILEAHR